MGPLPSPKVFVSYSHDSLTHRKRVWEFAKRLRDWGIDAVIDQYVPNPAEGFPKWMAAQIEAADFVVVICTAGYLRRLRRNEKHSPGHGVLWEAALIFQHVYIRSHPCAECVLMQYVPESRKGEDVPCHHIPLDPESRTVATLNAAEGEEVLKRWLRREINRLEGELAA
jgi:hypothetical protein